MLLYIHNTVPETMKLKGTLSFISTKTLFEFMLIYVAYIQSLKDTSFK